MKEKMKAYEKGTGLFLFGFLIMLSGGLLDYFDVVHNRVSSVVAWLGFFLGASGIITNLSILMKQSKK